MQPFLEWNKADNEESHSNTKSQEKTNNVPSWNCSTNLRRQTAIKCMDFNLVKTLCKVLWDH